MIALYHFRLWVPLPWWSPCGLVSVFFSSTSFVYGCLPGFATFGLPPAFIGSLSLSLGLLSAFLQVVPPYRPRSLRLSLPLFSLFPWFLSAVSGIGLRSVFTSLWFLSLLFFFCSVHTWSSLPCFGVFFVAAATLAFRSSWSVSLRFSSYSPLLPRSDLSSLCDGVALWDESVASVGSFAFSGSFSRTLYTAGWFRCHSLPFSLPLPFWASASSSSLPLPGAVFWCVRYGSLSSCLGSFLRLCLSCSSPVCVLFSFCAFGGASLGFSYGFPCGFPFILMHLLLFLHYYVVCFFRSPLFQISGECLGVGFTRLSPLVIVRHHRCHACICQAWHSSAPAPSPLNRCVYGDSSLHGSLPYRSLCL